MAVSSKAELPRRTTGRVIVLIFFLLFLYVVLPKLDSFSASFSTLKDARLELVGAALLLVLVTFAFAAGVYQSLALKLKGVQYRHTLLVQLAGAFTNRLLPAGLGALTLNVQYLRRHGHTLPQAIAVGGLNNTLGFVGHMGLLAIAVIIGRKDVVGHLELPQAESSVLVGLAIVLLAIICVVVFRGLRSRARKLAAEAVQYLGLYKQQPEKLVGALSCSIALTLCYVLIFYFSAVALGIDLTLGQLFVVFTVGMLAGTITPTPGGLIGAEAGLVAGLVAYGVDPSPALAIALLYRFLTYWLPLIPGFVIFLLIRKKYL